MAGPVFLDAMDLFVTTSPTTTLVASPSSTVSETTRPRAFSVQRTISAGENFDDILPLTQNESLSFHDYVCVSLQLLRAAGARVKAEPEKRSKIQREVMNFFVKSCLSKIKARFTAIEKTYGELSSLKNCKFPSSNPSIPPQLVAILNTWPQNYLHDAGIQHSADEFEFSRANVHIWWLCLVEMLLGMQRLIQEKSPSAIASASEAIHYYLSAIPTEMWKSQVLVDYLRTCRCSRPSEGEENAEDEVESTTDALPAGDDSLPTESLAFFRAVDAVCAWTTGPKYIPRSAMSKSTAPMVVSIVDFPRDPITEWSANVLLTRWRSLVRWNDETNRVVGERLVQYQKTAPGKTTSDEMARENTAAATEVTTTVVNTTTATAATEAAVNTTAATEAANAATTIVTTKGACHCEAGLIASLYLRKKKLLSTQKETQKEPPEVAKAFSNLPADNQEAYTIGVAKKCCPTCKILVDVLRGRELTLHIAGAHSRFHPWVPPQWLPDDVVEEVEKHLLKVIGELVSGKPGKSRASSPTSDGGSSDHFSYDPVQEAGRLPAPSFAQPEGGEAGK